MRWFTGGCRAVLIALAMLAPAVAESQPAAGKPRIGVLVFTDMTRDFREGFGQGLREQGLAEGRDVFVDWQAAGGRPERAAAIAADFARAKTDVIIAVLTPAVHAARKVTSEIPIVMAPAGDPVRQGFAQSLGRPGGNITGLTGVELSGKRVEILKETIPGLGSVALLLNRQDPSFAKVLLDGTGAVAKTLGIRVQAVMVRGADEFKDAFTALARDKAGAVIVQPSLIGAREQRAQVAALALQHRLPSISQSVTFVEEGALLSYGANFRDQHRQAARYVARILKGEKPAEMPIEQAATFDFVVNLKTARALGLAIPQSVLLRASRVIE
jgi:putative ABC transport system substrate-binding protein